MSSLGVRSNKKASNDPGLCIVKGQESGLSSRTWARNHLSSQSLSTTKTAPYCQLLVIHPAFCLYSYILPRDLQGRLRSYTLLNSTVSCEPAGHFMSSYPSMSRDPTVPQCVVIPQHVQRPNTVPLYAFVPSMYRDPIQSHYMLSYPACTGTQYSPTICFRTQHVQ